MRLQDRDRGFRPLRVAVRAQNLAAPEGKGRGAARGPCSSTSPRFRNLNPTLTAEHHQVYRLRFDHRAREPACCWTRIAQRKAEIASLEHRDRDAE